MLFKTTEEFQAYIPVNASLSIEPLRTHITTAEFRYLRDILGKNLYAKLQDDYDAESEDPAHLALLDASRKVVAPFAFFRYLPYLQANISDAGVRVAINETMRSAAKWQVEKIDEATELQGYMAVEQLLAFLEEYKEDYPLWGYSPSSVILPNATAFDAQVSIDGSRLIYLKLSPQLQQAERALERIASSAELNALRLAIQDDDLSPAQEAILPMVRRCIAHRAFGKGIVALPVRFDGKDIRVFASQFPGGSDFAPRVQAETPLLQILAKMHLAYAEEAEQELAKHLFANASEYPGYEASPAYHSPAVADTNSKKSGWFFA